MRPTLVLEVKSIFDLNSEMNSEIVSCFFFQICISCYIPQKFRKKNAERIVSNRIFIQIVQKTALKTYNLQCCNKNG